jgi:hypothetical protein
VASGASVSDGAWHLLDATYDGAQLRIYVDGTQSASAAATGSLVYASAALQIGRRDSAAPNWYAGSLDEVALYPSALTATQIAAHAAIGTDPNGQQCVDLTSADPAYTVVPGDVGKKLRVQVTATNSAGTATAISTAVTVTGPRPVNVSPPTITGTAEVGQTLTAQTGSWSGPGTPTYSYQWQRCGYGAAVMADSPGGYWRLDELTGTTLANQVPSSPGATLSGSYQLGNPGAVGDGSSVNFSGGDAQVPYYGGLNGPGTSFSLEFWYRGGPPPQADWMIAKDSPQNGVQYASVQTTTTTSRRPPTPTARSRRTPGRPASRGRRTAIGTTTWRPSTTSVANPSPSTSMASSGPRPRGREGRSRRSTPR